MLVPNLEHQIGVKTYLTDIPGVGGNIRRHFQDFIVEETLVDGSQAQVTKPFNQSSGRVLGSSSTKDRYLLCVLVKENWDTISAIQVMANRLMTDAENIQFAGLKDTKALTSQFITIEEGSAGEIRDIRIKDIELSPIGYCRNELSTYYLFGNHFKIKIRGINHSKPTIEKRINEILEELTLIGGAPNFYGHQRFGTVRPVTHLMGKAMIKENFEEAAMIYLANPSPHEHPESHRARKNLLKTKNFKEAFREFPKQLRNERRMLAHLEKKPRDFMGAFRRLPLQLRRLFPQAYQSYLFNMCLSERVEKGLSLRQAEIGDYVVGVERVGLPMIRIRQVTTIGRKTEINKAIQDGKMRLAIPIVGFKQNLSQGVQGEIEKDILRSEEIEPRNFMIKTFSEVSQKGGLRTMVVPIKNFSLNKVSEDTESSTKTAELSFTLHRGSYATVILREIMKSQDLIKAGY
ncbi:MAG: tRNA pseudouridine(13) synthase TruD [Candidatus Bathyarchaeota archaeon]